MVTKVLAATIVILTGVGLVFGQAAATSPGSDPSKMWRSLREDAASPSTGDASAFAVTTPGSIPPGAATTGRQQPDLSVAQPRPPIARVSTGNGVLPNDHGQIWREYDISPYTLRVVSTNRPEQAVIDWILRETGYEVWHSEPLGILSATPRTLRVYHAPQMQDMVADVVDRFVSSEAETYTFGLRVVTVRHPDWRARSQRFLRPVQVQTPGVQAWLLEKEDAAILLADLRRRNDFREHSSPHFLVNNGQSSVVSATRGRTYVRGVSLRPDVWPGFELETATADEGFSLEFSPLLSVDAKIIDATIKCNVDQVEKMVPVMLDVPTVVAPRQRTKIEVPQITHFRFHERFRWPVDQVLLVGMGMVALPVPGDGNSLVAGIPLPFPSSPPRADLLVFVQSNGKPGQASPISRAGRSETTTYRGRY